jgi:hypothetical protein
LLENEKRHCENLLRNILPAEIATRLRNAESNIADNFDDARQGWRFCSSNLRRKTLLARRHEARSASAAAIRDAKQCRHHKDLPCHSNTALVGRS